MYRTSYGYDSQEESSDSECPLPAVFTPFAPLEPVPNTPVVETKAKVQVPVALRAQPNPPKLPNLPVLSMEFSQYCSQWCEHYCRQYCNERLAPVLQQLNMLSQHLYESLVQQQRVSVDQGQAFKKRKEVESLVQQQRMSVDQGQAFKKRKESEPTDIQQRVPPLKRKMVDQAFKKRKESGSSDIPCYQIFQSKLKEKWLTKPMEQVDLITDAIIKSNRYNQWFCRDEISEFCPSLATTWRRYDFRSPLVKVISLEEVNELEMSSDKRPSVKNSILFKRVGNKWRIKVVQAV
jgi:hypothetical protein